MCNVTDPQVKSIAKIGGKWKYWEGPDPYFPVVAPMAAFTWNLAYMGKGNR